MKRFILSPSLARFFRQQQLYIAMAMAVYATFWAIRTGNANAIATLVYTLCLSNLVALMQQKLGFLHLPSEPIPALSDPFTYQGTSRGQKGRKNLSTSTFFRRSVPGDEGTAMRDCI
jgi:hypothetical protein